MLREGTHTDGKLRWIEHTQEHEKPREETHTEETVMDKTHTGTGNVERRNTHRGESEIDKTHPGTGNVERSDTQSGEEKTHAQQELRKRTHTERGSLHRKTSRYPFLSSERGINMGSLTAAQ